MKLWTARFGGALAVIAIFLIDAWWYGPDPTTGEPRHILPYMDTGIASFVFLLVFLFAISHFGTWALALFRRRSQPAGEAPKKGMRRSKKAG